MSAMSLEAEKNELIRRILDVDDVAILRRVKSMLSCEEEQTNVATGKYTFNPIFGFFNHLRIIQDIC